ncbi:MAG: PEP-CTERM sorting domain-containing protein [bacterium]
MNIQTAKTIMLNRLAPSCIALIGVVLGVASSTSSHAALIQITDIPGLTLGAPNGGVVNDAVPFTLGPSGGTAYAYSELPGVPWTGFFQLNQGLEFALAGLGQAMPNQFAAGETIDGSDLWAVFSWQGGALFKNGGYISPDFGPNTYMGFRSNNGSGLFNYGYLEVTWTAATDTFTIWGGAYESNYDVGITAPANAAAVPEPGQVAASLLLLCGIGGYIFLKRRKAARLAVATTAA